MLQRILPIVVSIPFFASSAAAEGFYAELGAGPAFVADSDLDTPVLTGEASFDTGYDVGGAFGYRLNEIFRTEVNLNYRQADVDEVETPTTTLDGAGDVGVFGAMVNGYVDLDLDSPIRPYAGAGIGLGIVMVDSDSAANVLVVDDESTEFAWNAMAGIAFAATDNVLLNAGYRYFSTSDATLDATITGFGPTRLDAEVGSHELVFGVRYEF